MIVWLAGARGLLGQAVHAELTARGIAHVDTDRDVDLSDGGAVEAFAAATPFTHAINCAAFTAVDACETTEAAAVAVNSDGAYHFARACRTRGAIAIHVSTDYVFDGRATVPYAEDAVPAPASAYGRTKLAGEQRFLSELANGTVIRTSWLFGQGGPCFPATILRLLASRPEIPIVDDQIGCPTWAGDLAPALATVLLGDGVNFDNQRGHLPGQWLSKLTPYPSGRGRVLHFANAGAVSWYGFATAIREAAAARGRNFDSTLVPITTAQFVAGRATPVAPRPAWSVLATDKIAGVLGAPPRPWREALVDYFQAGWPA